MNLFKSIKNLNRFEKCLWIFSMTVSLLCSFFSKTFYFPSLFASLVGVTALILVAKGDVWGQILTLLFGILYSVVSYKFRYFGEMITYLGFTCPIAVLSIITWIKNPYSETQVKVGKMTAGKTVILLVLTALVTFGFYFVLRHFNTPNIVFGTISIATSFLASSLMMLRSPLYAAAYGLNDIVLVVLWVLASLKDISYITMVACFAVFLINDVYGYLSWKKMMKNQQEK